MGKAQLKARYGLCHCQLRENPKEKETKEEESKPLSFLFLLHAFPTAQTRGSEVPARCPCFPSLATADHHLHPSQLVPTRRPPAASLTPPGSCPAASWWNTMRPTACAPSQPSCKSSPQRGGGLSLWAEDPEGQRPLYQRQGMEAGPGDRKDGGNKSCKVMLHGLRAQGLTWVLLHHCQRDGHHMLQILLILRRSWVWGSVPLHALH